MAGDVAFVGSTPVDVAATWRDDVAGPTGLLGGGWVASMSHNEPLTLLLNLWS